ncbi:MULTISPECIES: transglycosylase SLT domain-containing protein [unclassified Janthinobacterium]|uniref:transglycosylase SLT domain-containing protein n=1 Tax=unclassified Janthinobacterium TaxID=2610881 RepID=UPI000349271B|nr:MULTISPECIES: transglycosylase SLT domain-containing protein [unclassified Janthinobacterium]MEC5161723.1 soluble lytic murein transglycosylase [Janthinobacterium sp. CG_S6]
MPRVPVYDSAQVAPQQAPNPYRAPAQVDTGAPVREQAALGAALQQVGQQLTQEEVNAQGMANQVRVDAALNAVRQQQLDLTYNPENGYANKKGAAALDPDLLGRSLPQSYGEQLQDTISATAAGLGNDAQRRVFNEQATALATSFGGQVQSHMLQEYRQFGLETQQGTVKLASDAAKLNWNKPDLLAPQIASAQAAVWKAGQIAGEPANLTQAKIQATTSAIHSGVIDSALQNNEPAYALSYIESKKGQMSADDLLKANGLIKTDMRARVATNTAQNAMQSLQAKLTPTDGDRMVQITAQAESGGRETNRDGSTVTSPKGAQGIMQVMPATNTNPGFGIKPAADASPEERARVGRDYLRTMVQRYAGDPAKAWAAYNAGPGALDAAMTTAKKTGADWLVLMPKETQAYVANNVAKMQKSTVAPIPSQQDVHDRIRAQLGADPDPRLLQAALAEGTRQYTDFMGNRKVQGENATQAAYQALMQNKGNVPALSPDIKADVMQYAPDKWDSVMAFGDKIGKGQTVQTDWALFYKLKTDTAVLGATNLMALRDKLGDTEFKSLTEEQQNLLTGKVGDTTRLRSTHDVVNQYIREIGIDPTPRDTDAAGAKTVGKIWSTVEKRLSEAEKVAGRKLKSEEVTTVLSKLFTTVGVNRSWWFDGTKSAVMLGEGDKVAVPSADREQVIAALRARNKPVNENSILDLYKLSKGIK